MNLHFYAAILRESRVVVVEDRSLLLLGKKHKRKQDGATFFNFGHTLEPGLFCLCEVSSR